MTVDREIRIRLEPDGMAYVSAPPGLQSMRIVSGRSGIAAATGHRVAELVGEMLDASHGPSLPPAVDPLKVPYGYRSDPAVPAFPDDRPVVVFDGHCALCSGWVRFLVRHDRRRRYRFLPAQSSVGQALYAHYGLDTRDFETNILLEDGLPRLRMDGTVRMAAGLGFPWTLARAVRILPARAQDALYRLVARNRYRLGRLDACMMPDPADADRFIA